MENNVQLFQLLTQNISKFWSVNDPQKAYFGVSRRSICILIRQKYRKKKQKPKGRVRTKKRDKRSERNKIDFVQTMKTL